MDIENISEKFKSTVSDENIEHAKKINIVILRTIDLLFLMRKFEEKEDPSREFIAICNSGWGEDL